MDFSTSTLWTGPFLLEGMSGYFLLLPCLIESTVFNANSVDPDQTPRSAASDLGLYCLLMSLLWDARLKWVQWLHLQWLTHFSLGPKRGKWPIVQTQIRFFSGAPLFANSLAIFLQEHLIHID